MDITGIAKSHQADIKKTGKALSGEVNRYICMETMKCVEISLSANSAVLFSEAVSPSDFASPFNDSRQSLKGTDAGRE
jgi:hypothetical protein